MAAKTKSQETAGNADNTLLPPSVFASGSHAANSNSTLKLIPPNVYKTPPKSSSLVKSSMEVPRTSQNQENLPPSGYQSRKHSPVKHLSRHSSYTEVGLTERESYQSPDRHSNEMSLEVDRLRRENYKLMEENLKRTYEYGMSKSDTETRQSYTASKSSNNHLELLIDKQVLEITALKQKLLDQVSQHEKTISSLQSEFTERQKHMQYQIDSIQHQARQAEDKHITELNSVLAEKESSCNSLRLEIDALRTELKGKESEIEKNVLSNQQLKKSADSVAQQMEKYNEQLQGKDTTIKNLRSQIQLLQQREGDRDKWPAIKAQLETRLKLAEDERDDLRDEVECLSLRIEAVNDILKAQQESLKADNQGADEDRLNLLLDRWRTKVFELLVQKKSSELVQKKDSQRAKQTENSLTNQIKQLNCRLRELESVIKERDSQITLLNRHKQSLELSSIASNKRITQLEKEIHVSERNSQLLVDAVAEYEKRFTHQTSVLSSIMTRLGTYGNRLLCADQLVVRCQDKVRQLSCSERDSTENLMTSQSKCSDLEDRVHQLDIVNEDSHKKIEELQRLLLKLNSDLQMKDIELEKVKDERDCLTHRRDLELKKMTIDIETAWGRKLDDSESAVADLKRELAKTIVTLRQTEKQLNSSKLSHRKELDSLTEQLSEQMRQLQTDLAKAQTERNILQTNLSAVNSVRDRKAAVVSWSCNASTEHTPVKQDQLSISLPISPLAAQSLVGSVKKLADVVLNSESDYSDTE